MAYNLTNGRLNQSYDLVTCILELPIQGVWYMEKVRVDTDQEFIDGDSVTVDFLDKTLSGVFIDTVNYNGYVVGTIIGGKNTMSMTIDSVGYVGVSVNTIVSFIAQKTGHTIDSASNQKILSTAVSRFENMTARASDMLERALQPYNAIWRITLDGKLFIGLEEYPDISIRYPTLIENQTYDVLDKKQDQGYWSIYNEEILIEPSFSISGNTVKEVIYDLNVEAKEYLTIKLDFYDPAYLLSYNLSSEVKEYLYFKRYRMKVSLQKPDGTITCFPDPDLDLLKNGLRDVPIIYPMPDMQIKVKAGAICYVEFANGDPGLPRITGWESNDKLVEVIYAVSKNPQPVGRVGDTVDCGYIQTLPSVIAGSVTFNYYDPDGISTPFAGLSAPMLTGTGFVKVPIKGKISSGSKIVSAGSQ